MDLKAYIDKREKREAEVRFREICPRCFRPQKICLCSTVRPFDTDSHFVILMHTKEARKTRMGTGRLTHLFLRNSEIWAGVDFSSDSRINSLIADPQYSPFLLYPGEDSVDLSKDDSLFSRMEERKLLIFVIDASWPLAKKTLKLSKNLQALPQIRFRPTSPSLYGKKQPHEYCLCTLESVCILLEELEKRGLESCGGKPAAMLTALEEMGRLQSEQRRDSQKKGYRRQDIPRREPWPPGKRQRRSVRFEDENRS